MNTGLALDDAAWQSPWLRRDVRDKAGLSLGLVSLALVLPVWPGALLVAVTSTVLLLGPARIRPSVLARCLLAPATFIIIGALSVAVTLTWDGGLGMTPESLTSAASLGAHGVAGTLAVLVLAATTPMVDLMSGLSRARVPQVCVEIAALVYRLLFTLLESVGAIREAQVARLGYDSRRAAMRSAAVLTGSVLLRAWQRAQRLEEGLAGRGYSDNLRTLDPPRHASARFLAGAGLLLVLIAAASVLISQQGLTLR